VNSAIRRFYIAGVSIAVGAFVLLFVFVLAPINAENSNAASERSRKIASYENFTMGVWNDKPIEWRVLDVQEGKALVISEDNVTVRQFDGLEKQYGKRLADADIDWSDVFVTWEDSEIRAWLNDVFLDEAFSKSEKDNILISETQDRVFLLSLDEAEEYFISNEDRQVYFEMTNNEKNYILNIAEEDWGYGEIDLIRRSEELDSNYLGRRLGWWWWLRSPGNISGTAARVYYDGGIGDHCHLVYFDRGGVRPALYLTT